MTAKAWFACFALLCCAMTLAIAAVIFLVDPYQFFRADTRFGHQLTDQRHDTPGLILHRRYDAIIVGSSMTENFLCSDVDQALGVNSINLSLSGANGAEINRLLNLAMGVGKPHTVLLGLDPYAFKGDPVRLTDDSDKFPSLLYRRIPFAYLTSFKALKLSLWALTSAALRSGPRSLDLNAPYYWGDKYSFGVQAVLENKTPFLAGFRAEDYAPETLRANLSDLLLPLVRSNPEVRFLIFLPPYSQLAWRDFQTRGVLQNVLDFRMEVAKALLPLENVRLFDFQADPSIIMNLDNYKDLTHYSPAINKRILSALAEGQARVRDLAEMASANRQLLLIGTARDSGHDAKQVQTSANQDKG